MDTSRFFAVVSILLFLLSIAPAAKVKAADACPLRQENFAALAEIQNNPNLDYVSRVHEELKIRKSLLHETIDCAIEEALALKSDFDSVKISNEDAGALQRQFSLWFQEILNYYTLQKSQIDNLGLQGTKDFAKNFLVWREGNFQPTAKLVSYFIIWARNQELFDTGKNRLSQMKRAVDVFNLSLNEEIRNGLAEAEAQLQKTSAYNQRLKDIIRTYGSADDAALAAKMFFESLAKTYENLLSLAVTINKAIAK